MTSCLCKLVHFCLAAISLTAFSHRIFKHRTTVTKYFTWKYQTKLHFFCRCSYLFTFILYSQFYWHIRLKSTAYSSDPPVCLSVCVSWSRLWAVPKWLNRLRCRLGCQHAGGYAQGNTILSGSWIPTERDTFGRSHSGMPTLACGRYSQMYSLEDSSNAASGYQSTVATCCDLSATYRRVQCAWPLCQQCRRCRKAQTVGNDRCTAVGWLDTALPMARNTHTQTMKYVI